MRLISLISAAALLVAAPVAAQTQQQIDYLVTGAAAKLTCSGVFVSGREADDVGARDVDPLLGPLGGDLTYRVDEAAGTLTASRGASARTAHHRPGLGCTLAYDDAPDSRPDPRHDAPRPLEAADLPEGADPAALTAAIDTAFADTPGLDTRAFLVVHDGRIVAERYAEGFDAETPLLGWSMSKTVIGALIGLLIEDGRLSLDDAVWPDWPEGDPRRAIRVADLLHMSSGLAFREDYSGVDDVSLMLFAQADMAAYAASLAPAAEPGARWLYSSGDTLILSRLLVRTLGSSEAVQAYAHDRLFGPLGMTGTVMEEDAAGTPVGSSYVYAPARDWARFGLMLKNDGRVGDTQVLPASWVEWMRTPAPASAKRDYGGQLWLNGLQEVGGTEKAFDLPDDAFYLNGHNGQMVMVVPSLDLVVVRMGWTTGQTRTGMWRTLAAVVAALGLTPET